MPTTSCVESGARQDPDATSSARASTERTRWGKRLAHDWPLVIAALSSKPQSVGRSNAEGGSDPRDSASPQTWSAVPTWATPGWLCQRRRRTEGFAQRTRAPTPRNMHHCIGGAETGAVGACHISSCQAWDERGAEGVMNRATLILGLSLATSGLSLARERDAAACGGCFHPPTQTVSDITDERMLLSVSTLQSTLYDQLRYTGSPTNFAWVLPIHGTVDVGLSADVLFDSMDVLTETQINPPAPNCPTPNCFMGGSSGAATAGGGAEAPAGTVTVTKQENVGPYATVQLHATDSSALDNWLAQNGYNVAADVAPVIAEYVAEGFDFLAMKLLPNQGVQAMRPVRVTTPGASLSLPLRMAAVGTGAITGITIWVIADGRYEPQNFPFFHIDDSQLVWDWSSNISNYTTLRVQDEANLKNAGWEIESSIAVNEQLITKVIESGGQY